MRKIVTLAKTVFLALGLALSPLAVSACEVKSGDLLLCPAWARASAGQAANGAAYVTLTNTGPQADRLLSASSPVAAAVELHTHITEGGVMKMRAVPGMDVPAQGKVEMGPGGLHIMLLGLNAPLKEGSSFPLTLTFQRTGAVTLDVAVGGAGAMGSQFHGQHGQHHGH